MHLATLDCRFKVEASTRIHLTSAQQTSCSIRGRFQNKTLTSFYTLELYWKQNCEKKLNNNANVISWLATVNTPYHAHSTLLRTTSTHSTPLRTTHTHFTPLGTTLHHSTPENIAIQLILYLIDCILFILDLFQFIEYQNRISTGQFIRILIYIWISYSVVLLNCWINSS